MKKRRATGGNGSTKKAFGLSSGGSRVKSRREYLLLFGMGPLVLGFLYYEIFCPEVFFVKRLGLLFGSRFPRVAFPPGLAGNFLWRLARNHLADFLWAQSLTAALLFLGSLRRRKMLVSFALSSAIVTLMELIQISPYVLLTYDSLDIAAQLLGASAAFLAWRLFGIEERIQNDER